LRKEEREALLQLNAAEAYHRGFHSSDPGSKDVRRCEQLLDEAAKWLERARTEMQIHRSEHLA
jgi:hypothetical protein